MAINEVVSSKNKERKNQASKQTLSKDSSPCSKSVPTPVANYQNYKLYKSIKQPLPSMVKAYNCWILPWFHSKLASRDRAAQTCQHFTLIAGDCFEFPAQNLLA